MNLHAIVNPCIAVVNPNFTGTLLQSAGYAYPGDAAFTASIAGPTMTVSAVQSGSIAMGSLVAGSDILPATTVTDLGTGQGGPGAYTVAPSQTVPSGPLTCTGTGKRVPQWTTFTNISMQFQDLTSDELKQIDGLNISEVMRSVYLNGEIQGLDRAGVKGGDMLLAPTNLSSGGSAVTDGGQIGVTDGGVVITADGQDTWLVVKVFEAFDAAGWTKVAVTLQQAVQAQ